MAGALNLGFGIADLGFRSEAVLRVDLQLMPLFYGPKKPFIFPKPRFQSRNPEPCHFCFERASYFYKSALVSVFVMRFVLNGFG